MIVALLISVGDDQRLLRVDGAAKPLAVYLEAEEIEQLRDLEPGGRWIGHAPDDRAEELDRLLWTLKQPAEQPEVSREPWPDDDPEATLQAAKDFVERLEDLVDGRALALPSTGRPVEAIVRELLENFHRALHGRPARGAREDC